MLFNRSTRLCSWPLCSPLQTFLPCFLARLVICRFRISRMITMILCICSNCIIYLWLRLCFLFCNRLFRFPGAFLFGSEESRRCCDFRGERWSELTEGEFGMLMMNAAKSGASEWCVRWQQVLLLWFSPSFWRVIVFIWLEPNIQKDTTALPP
jgi:hypothetical protein